MDVDTQISGYPSIRIHTLTHTQCDISFSTVQFVQNLNYEEISSQYTTILRKAVHVDSRDSNHGPGVEGRDTDETITTGRRLGPRITGVPHAVVCGGGTWRTARRRRQSGGCALSVRTESSSEESSSQVALPRRPAFGPRIAAAVAPVRW